MGKWKEVSSGETLKDYNKSFEMWESGVIDTLHSLPVGILKDLTKTKDLGYYASIVLSNKQKSM